MLSAAAIKRHPVKIGNAVVRCDDHDRYNLNDLHAAAGGHPSQQPAFFMRNGQTQRLIEALHRRNLQIRRFTPAPIERRRGRYGGTFVARPLVYAYAAWISADFHLTVLDVFDAVLSAHVGLTNELHAHELLNAQTLHTAREGGRLLNQRRVALRAIRADEQRLRDLVQFTLFPDLPRLTA